jgi:hypothetical protein
MNHYLTHAFVKKLKDENNRKANEQLRHGSVQRTELPTTPDGDRKSMYSSVSKWLRS